MSNLLERKNVLKVKKYLENFDQSIKLIELNNTARTAQDAANSLNKEVGSIVKSLVFKDVDNYFYLCLVSGDKYICINKLSKILNKEIFKANADDVKKQTGFSIGGVSPIAHVHSPFKVLIDKHLNRFQNIYAAAGHPFVVFEITFKKICIMTKGQIEIITV